MEKFEIVKLFDNNDPCEPYTMKAQSSKSVEVYAIKVDGLFFLLGGAMDSLHICDIDSEYTK